MKDKFKIEDSEYYLTNEEVRDDCIIQKWSSEDWTWKTIAV